MPSCQQRARADLSTSVSIKEGEKLNFGVDEIRKGCENAGDFQSNVWKRETQCFQISFLIKRVAVNRTAVNQGGLGVEEVTERGLVTFLINWLWSCLRVSNYRLALCCLRILGVNFSSC